MSSHLNAAIAVLTPIAVAAAGPTNPFVALAVYNGSWVVRATHPWNGAPTGAVNHLTSRCHRFTAYFACEQTIDGKAASILVYTLAGDGRFNTRMIAPDGLAGARGDLVLSGSLWTYIDKPPATLKGNWSRVDNDVIDHDHIRFEEYESADEGRTWHSVNAGTEVRR